MPQSVKERVGKLREEIAEISEANRLYLQGGKKMIGASDQERRLQRLQEIMDELMSLTDWKKPCSARGIVGPSEAGDLRFVSPRLELPWFP